MKAWTDYPILALGDVSGELAPIRECEILSYDGNKYCEIRIGGGRTEVKAGYLYSRPGRVGEAPCVDLSMTDNTEREAFEKVCPVPEGVEVCGPYYIGNGTVNAGNAAEIYQAKWEGFQLGLAGKVRRLEAEIERLTAELAAAKGLLGECLESLYGVPMSKRVRGDSRLGDAVERFLGEK